MRWKTVRNGVHGQDLYWLLQDRLLVWGTSGVSRRSLMKTEAAHFLFHIVCASDRGHSDPHHGVCDRPQVQVVRSRFIGENQPEISRHRLVAIGNFLCDLGLLCRCHRLGVVLCHFSINLRWGEDTEGFLFGEYLKLADTPGQFGGIVPGVFIPLAHRLAGGIVHPV